MEGRRKCYYRRPFAKISRSDQLAAAISGSNTTSGEEVKVKVERKDEPGSSKEPTSGDKSSGTEEEGPKPQVGAPAPPVIDAGPPPELLLEYEASVTVPKLTGSSISIMRFHDCHGVDPSKWKSLKMAREDNSKIHQTFCAKTEMPKFGGGSEYGREAKEEALRRKYESKKKYKPEDQPWVMKTSNKEKFRGVKEGGVADNAAYFIMEQTNAGTFEAFPVSDWYSFTPMERYRALNSEQAEEQFDRRNKIHNFFSVMIKNRIKTEDEDENSKSDKAESGKLSKRGNTGFKVSEMDDWEDSDHDEDDSDNDGTKPKKPNGKGKSKAKSNPDEDSDDGDGEGREVDYITDTSESESEEEQQKKMGVGGVEEEKGLRNLLDSETDEEEEKEPGEKEDENSQSSQDGKKKEKSGAVALAEALEAHGPGAIKVEPEDPTNLDDSSVEPDTSGAVSLKAAKWRPILDRGNAVRKSTTELCPQLVKTAAANGITEEAVRRYLLRKPFTVTELVRKFKSKMGNFDKHEVINVICHLLKKIDPARMTIKGTLYLSLSAGDTAVKSEGQEALPSRSEGDSGQQLKRSNSPDGSGTTSSPPVKVSRKLDFY